MSDLIDRQTAIATAISGRVRTLPTTEDGEDWIRVNEVRDSLLTLPSAQPTQTNAPNALKSLDCISRQAAIDAIGRDPMGGLNYERILKYLPTADAVEVVRCKECKHFETCSWSEHEDDGFCKWGERGLADG